MTYNLISAHEYTDNDEEYENLHFDIEAQVKGGETALYFNSGDLGTLVDDFSRDADGILDESLYVSF